MPCPAATANTCHRLTQARSTDKQGPRILRWALCEAIQHQPAGTRPRQVKDAITARRGAGARSIAKTAAARVLLTDVFYALRDGRVRRAASPAA